MLQPCFKFIDSWKEHVNYLNSKIAEGSWAISKIKPYVNIKTLRTLYYCLIYLHLQYCILSWGRASQTTLRPLKTTQKRILRIITRSPYCTPSTPLFSELELLKPDDTYKLKIAITVYNKHNGNLPGTQILINLTNLHDHNTRLSSKLNFFYHQSIQTQVNPTQYFQALKYGMRSPETLCQNLNLKKPFKSFYFKNIRQNNTCNCLVHLKLLVLLNFKWFWFDYQCLNDVIVIMYQYYMNMWQ